MMKMMMKMMVPIINSFMQCLVSMILVVSVLSISLCVCVIFITSTWHNVQLMIMVMVKKDNFDGHSDYYGDGYYGQFIIMIIEYYDGNDNGEIDIVYGDGPLFCEDLQLKF